MNTVQIINAGMQSGLCDHEGRDEDSVIIFEHLRLFASLVAVNEREACAKICETLEPVCYDTAGYMDCAAAIRVRE